MKGFHLSFCWIGFYIHCVTSGIAGPPVYTGVTATHSSALTENGSPPTTTSTSSSTATPPTMTPEPMIAPTIFPAPLRVDLTPTAYPPGYTGLPCVAQWSAWINTDTPDTGDGDRESWSDQEKVSFCRGWITSVECQTVNGSAPYTTGETVHCSIYNGLMCLNAENDQNRPCSDYTIRYYCSCRENVANYNTRCLPPCFIGSGWIDMDTPETGDGDRESWSYQMQHFFCPTGTITVECQTQDRIASYNTGEIMQCSLENGSVCLNADNNPKPCSNYWIQYYCDTCATTRTSTVTPPMVPRTSTASPPPGPSGTSTASPPPGSSGTTTTSPPQGPSGISTASPPQGPARSSTISPPPGPTCLNHWSAWINTDTPGTGDDDRESWSYQEKYAFCPTGIITAVDCQTVDGIPFYNTCENVQCSIQNGSVCLKYPRSCSDYQIRYYCSTCSTCPFRIRPVSAIQIPEVSTRTPASMEPAQEVATTTSSTAAVECVTSAHHSLTDICNPLQLGVVVGIVSLIWLIIIIVMCVYFKVVRKNKIEDKSPQSS